MSWYYAKDGQQVGPISQQEIEAKFRSGEISSEALVWEEGMPDWLPAGQVMAGAVAVSDGAQPLDSLYSAPESTNAPSLSGAGNIDAVIKRASFAKLLILVIGGYVLVIAGAGLLSAAEESSNTTLMTAGGISLAVGMIPMIWGLVLGWIYLHRSWVIVNCGLPGMARTTPGKAVGFMFIPFYNLYWTFQAFAGLAQDYNAASNRNGWNHQMPEGLFSTFSVLNVLGYIPIINYISGLGQLVVAPMTFYQICKMINHHANA